jgi:hypothetical protein
MNRVENFSYLVSAAKEREQRSALFLESNSRVLQDRQRSPFAAQTTAALPPQQAGPRLARAVVTRDPGDQEPSAVDIRHIITGLWGGGPPQGPPVPAPLATGAVASRNPSGARPPAPEQLSGAQLHVSVETISDVRATPPPSVMFSSSAPSSRRIQTPGRQEPMGSDRTPASYSDIPTLSQPHLVGAATRLEQPQNARRDPHAQPTMVGWGSAREVDQLRRRIHVPTTPAGEPSSQPTLHTLTGNKDSSQQPYHTFQHSSLLSSNYISHTAKLVLLGKEAEERRDAITIDERQQFAAILADSRTSYEHVARGQLIQRIRLSLSRLVREEQTTRLTVLDEEASGREETLQFATVSFGRTLVLSKERAAQRLTTLGRQVSEEEFVARRTVELDESATRAAIAHNTSKLFAQWKIDRAIADTRHRLQREYACLHALEADRRRELVVSEEQLRDTLNIVLGGVQSRMIVLHQQAYQRKLRLAEADEQARTFRTARDALAEKEQRMRALVEQAALDDVAVGISARAAQLMALQQSAATARQLDADWRLRQDMSLREQEERDVLEHQEQAARTESIVWRQQLLTRARTDAAASLQRRLSSLAGQEAGQRAHMETLREEFARQTGAMLARQLQVLRRIACLGRELCDEEYFERGIVESMEQRAFTTLADFAIDERQALQREVERRVQQWDRRARLVRLDELEQDERESLWAEQTAVVVELVKRRNRGFVELHNLSAPLAVSSSSPPRDRNPSSSSAEATGTLPSPRSVSVAQPLERRVMSVPPSPPRDRRAAELSLLREEEVDREIVAGCEFRVRTGLVQSIFASSLASLAAGESRARGFVEKERGVALSLLETQKLLLGLMREEEQARLDLFACHLQHAEGLKASWLTLRARVEQAAEVRAQLVAEIRRRQQETQQQEVSARRMLAIEESRRRSIVQSAVTVAIVLLRFFAAESHDRATISDFFEYERWNLMDMEMMQRRQIIDSEVSPLGSDTEDDAGDGGAALREVPPIDAASDSSTSSVDDVFADAAFRTEERRQMSENVKVHSSFEVSRAQPPPATVHTQLEARQRTDGVLTTEAVVSRGGLVVHSSSFMAAYPPPSHAAPLSRPAWRSTHPHPEFPQIATRQQSPPRGGAGRFSNREEIAVAEEDSRSRLEALEAHVLVELLKYDAESLLALDL